MIEKPPCSTCKEICENAIGLYKAFHGVSPLKVELMGLTCPKTGKSYEIKGV